MSEKSLKMNDFRNNVFPRWFSVLFSRVSFVLFSFWRVLIESMTEPTTDWERRQNLERDVNHGTTEFFAAERQENKLGASLTSSQRSSAFANHLKPSSEGRELNFQNYDVENGLNASKNFKTAQNCLNAKIWLASWTAGVSKVTIDDVLSDMKDFEEEKSIFHSETAKFMGSVKVWHKSFRIFEKKLRNIGFGCDLTEFIAEQEILTEEAEKLSACLNDFSIKMPSHFKKKDQKIRKLVHIVNGFCENLNKIWTEFKGDFNAKYARLNGVDVEIRPKVKPEAQAQNFRVGNNVRVWSEFFHGESIGQRPSTFFENNVLSHFT